MVRIIINLTIVWVVQLLLLVGTAEAECSARCKKLKRAEIIGILDGKEYLQRSRDMLVVRNKRVAKRQGYSAPIGCENDGASIKAGGRCAPAILSTRDLLYFCPQQVKAFRSVRRAERKGFSAYTSCGSLTPLPTPTVTPSTTPIPRSREFTAESGVRVSGIDSASITPLNSGGYRAYIGKSGVSFDAETIYYADSADGLTFGALTAIGGIAPSGGSETLSRPTVRQLADNSFALIYEKIRHISSAAVDLHSLMRAVSPDGATFTNMPATIVIPGASAISFYFNPEMVGTDDGVVRIYYSSALKMNSAVSTDEGATWVEEGEITLNGTGDNFAPYPGEPAVVREQNGKYLMFFSSPVTSDQTRSSIFTAESEDGRTFTAHDEPLVVSPEGATYYSPAALKQNDGSIRLYYLDHSGSFENPVKELKSLISP